MPDWKRASACNTGSCVEVAFDQGLTLVRDTARPGVILRFNPDEWDAFLKGVNAGEFDAPAERTQQ